MTTEPTTLTIREPRDLVALVPYRLGFVPQSSLVLVSLRAERSHVGLVLRIDLADVAAGGLQVLQQLAEHMTDDAARRVVAVIYDCAPQRTKPFWLEQLRHTLLSAGVDLVDAWHVDEHHFRSLLCVSPSCCPARGWPLRDLQSTVVSAEMVALGISPAASRQALLPVLTPHPARALRRVAGRVDRALECGGPSRARRLAGLQAWRSLLEVQGPPSEPAAAQVLVALAHPWARDAVLLTCVPGAQDVPDRLAVEGPDELVHALMDGVFGSPDVAPIRPDEVLLERACAALAEVARYARSSRRADPLAVMAWAAWWSGDGALAGDLVDLALESSPDHALCGLVQASVRSGMAPAWVASEQLAARQADRGNR